MKTTATRRAASVPVEGDHKGRPYNPGHRQGRPYNPGHRQGRPYNVGHEPGCGPSRFASAAVEGDHKGRPYHVGHRTRLFPALDGSRQMNLAMGHAR